MNPLSSIAQSGLAVAQQRLQTSAHNLANAGTEGFHRQAVQSHSLASGGAGANVVRAEAASDGLFVDDVVEQLSASQAFAANLKSLQTEDRLLGALLDIRA